LNAKILLLELTRFRQIWLDLSNIETKFRQKWLSYLGKIKIFHLQYHPSPTAMAVWLRSCWKYEHRQGQTKHLLQ